MSFIPPASEATFVQTFADNTTLDIVIGSTATPGAYFVEASVRNTVSGEVEAYQVTVGVGASGGAVGNVLRVPGPSPLYPAVDPSVVDVGASVALRLVGTGAGDLIEVKYRQRFISA